MSWVASHLRGVPPVFLVHEGSAPRAMASPEMIATLAEAEQRLVKHEAIEGSMSWDAFLRHIHRQVVGETAGALPVDSAAIEQYLLLLGRPQDTQLFASHDLSLAAARIRLSPGEGRQLGQLAEVWPAGGDGPALAGEAVVLAVAARLQAHDLLRGLWLSLCLLPLFLFLGVGSGSRSGLLVWLATGTLLPCLAAYHSFRFGSQVMGHVSPEVLLAAGLAAGLASLAYLSDPQRDAIPLCLLLLAPQVPILLSPFADSPPRALLGLAVPGALGSVLLGVLAIIAMSRRPSSLQSGLR